MNESEGAVQIECDSFLWGKNKMLMSYLALSTLLFELGTVGLLTTASSARQILAGQDKSKVSLRYLNS